jgi:hypothetical protein
VLDGAAYSRLRSYFAASPTIGSRGRIGFTNRCKLASRGFLGPGQRLLSWLSRVEICPAKAKI